MRPVIFDMHIGVDDGMVLLFLHCAPEIDTVAITTRIAKANINDTTRNALAVVGRFNIFCICSRVSWRWFDVSW